MIDSKDLVRRLDLLRASPSFVFREEGDEGKAVVEQASTIPVCGDVVWVAGKTVLPDGTELASVFRLVPEAGDVPVSVYWWVNDKWFASDDPDALPALQRTREMVFPFSWRYALAFPTS
jgi:hypothetical protein